MRRVIVVLFVLLGAGLVGASDERRPPNLLFILTDDQGWSSLGCYGSRLAPTPHLDRLAAAGVRFTAAYVTPQCTPTRGAILTGQHPARSRMWHVIGWYGYPWAPVREPEFAENLSRESFTLAKGLQAAGYATGCLGKWHLTTGEDGDYTRLRPAGATFYGFDAVSAPGPGSHNEGDKHVAHLTDEAIAFIAKNQDRPWFCWLAHHTIHGVVSAPAELVKKYRERGAPAEGLHNATYLAAIEHLDAAVGRLLAALDERGLTDNTLVVFLSDNGGVDHVYDATPFTQGTGNLTKLTVKSREFASAPLRGTKGTLYEGGIRVPCLVRWPGVTKPGTICDTPIQATDWLPTLLVAAGTKAPAEHPLDGANLRPLLEGEPWIERSLYWYAPLYDLRWGATPAAAARKGRHKLIEHFGDSFDSEGNYRPGHRVELYDLAADLGETTDLAARQPELARELRADLHRHLAAVRAEIPTANPAHDPLRPLRETRVKPR
ncbi:MAG: sulfatase [Pirellulaceae bacterium]|nr:sulfatase [Pirellulaceae bacterium]